MVAGKKATSLENKYKFRSRFGYPAIRLDPKGSKIYGMVFHSKDLESNIKKIDEFEGDNYKRVISKIFLEDGSQIDSYLYELI